MDGKVGWESFDLFVVYLIGAGVYRRLQGGFETLYGLMEWEMTTCYAGSRTTESCTFRTRAFISLVHVLFTLYPLLVRGFGMACIGEAIVCDGLSA